MKCCSENISRIPTEINRRAVYFHLLTNKTDGLKTINNEEKTNLRLLSSNMRNFWDHSGDLKTSFS